MDPYIIPTPHPDPWVNLLHAYLSEAVAALTTAGAHVHRSWLDPVNPRDATVVYARRGGDPVSSGALALVWDEETGWRRGRFVDGRQGRRTSLTEVAHLGDGALPEPREVAWQVVSGVVSGGESRPRRYRAFGDVRDGFDDWLRARTEAVAGLR